MPLPVLRNDRREHNLTANKNKGDGNDCEGEERLDNLIENAMSQ